MPEVNEIETSSPAGEQTADWDRIAAEIGAGGQAPGEAAEARAAAEAATPKLDPLAVPYFIKQCHEDFLSKIAHVFVLHGNITDYADNTGSGNSMETLLSTVYDSAWTQQQILAQNKGALPSGYKPPAYPKVFAYYTMNDGLVFVCKASRDLWEAMMRDHYKGNEELESWLKPSNDVMSVMQTLNQTFRASKATEEFNRTNVEARRKSYEHHFTVAFFNGNSLFPAGPMLMLQGDRWPIGYVYNWARDNGMASRNRVIILTPALEDIHETIRGADSGVSTVLVRRPNKDEREAWLANYEERLAALPARGGLVVGGKKRRTVEYQAELKQDRAPDSKLSEQQYARRTMAVLTAGMNLRQMEQVIRICWRNDQPVDVRTIMEHKRRAIEASFGGLVNFVEPSFGFEEIGGHDNIKEYFLRKVKRPLKNGDARRCSKGFIMLGPAGCGKTKLALAMAKESDMSYLEGNLSLLFGGVVGQTEANMAKFLSAVDSSAPCLVFLDELDSVLSSGRSSPGDSGTAGRMFHSLMTFLSDDKRAGRVVVIAASNRADLIDGALIRMGRMDGVLPTLPPNPESPNCRKERMNILVSLSRKHHVKLHKELEETVKLTDGGLGRLLNDTRIWTGAEIEVVLKEALDNCEDSGRSVIGRKDWDEAMDSVLPNTRDVELQIDQALLNMNLLKYCPNDWRERARNKGDLKSNIKAIMSDGSWSEREA